MKKVARMQIVSMECIALASAFQPEDDIDRLFGKLERHEPPTNLVAHILKRIHQLPAEQIYQSPTTPTNVEKSDEPIREQAQ